jgi:hypothetical protein
MKAVRTSETSVYINETTWRCIPEGCQLHSRGREKVKCKLYSSFMQNRGFRGFYRSIQSAIGRTTFILDSPKPSNNYIEARVVVT